MAPAARALALVTGDRGRDRRQRPHGQPGACPGRGAARHADHPRHRDRATVARLRAADPARGRPCQAERQGGRAQRPLVQRLRHGRAPHLHQCRRAVRRQDAERDHRRVRARNRPSGRRPSVAPARAARLGADRLDRRHAARRRRHGGRRARRRRRRRCRHGGDHGAAVGDPALAARLCAHPGRPGRPCRREIPQRHRPVAAAAWSNCSSA